MVAIGKIVRVHGVHGDVKVRSYSDVPRRFEGLKQVAVAGPAGEQRMLTVRASRRIADGYLVAFEEVGTPEAAAPLVGSLLRIPQERLAPLPDGRYYECDLLGMDVFMEEGVFLGVIAEILSTRSNAVFVVRGSGDVEHLIPGTKEVVRMVDVPGRRLTVRRVAGLLEDQLPSNAL
jgi:16S rRNA processing protein RimM